jgi:acetate---CoA ligase (ADP-forming) subunit beta
MELIEKALGEGRTSLSEYESKRLLSLYDVPVAREIPVWERSDLADAVREIGYPLVLKGLSPEILHKTEKNVIKVDIRSENEAIAAFDEIVANMAPIKGAVLVQEFIKGQRELMVGMTRDPQFGPCVMFGLGGIFTEILRDVSFRMAPLARRDAFEMMREIKGHKILEAVRGMPPVDLDLLAGILVDVGRMSMENERIKEIDINPLIVRDGTPIAVDALVVLA